MDDIIDYIKQFLVYGNEEVAKHIGYTADENDWRHYKLVIVPGKNILTGERREWDEPDLSTPAKAEKQGEFTDEFGEAMGGTWVIREDIIYNTLFCLSLAGEFGNEIKEDDDDPILDLHGRMPSRRCPLGKQGLWTIPVVDEYSRLCTKLLEAPLPEQHFSKIILSHDIDTIEHFRHLRGLIGGVLRGQIQAILGAITNVEEDPAYTFPWLHDQDKKVSGAEEIYFIKAGEGKSFDYPQYDLYGADCKHLLDYLHSIDATIGLHTSYAAASLIEKTEETEDARDIILKEKEGLEEAIDKQTEFVGLEIAHNRWHFLRITSAKCLQALANAGITDDYSIGWADHIGFRLGTTRPVKWINPKTFNLTDLTLHPLCVMDASLSNENYMNIQDEEEAYYTCQQVIDKVRQHGGELCLLWHNSNVEGDGYHKQLYSDIIDYLSE